MRSAAIFPGQGSEYPGMLSGIKDAGITRDIFGALSTVAGKDILPAALDHTDALLNDPLVSQLAVFGASACYWHLLGEAEDFGCLAGHSLGFYAALYASGAVSLEDCAGIIIKVQEAIETVSGKRPARMASIMGLKTELVEEICRQAGDAYIANINSATQTVISGWRDNVMVACSMASEAGALGVKELPIAFPLHSRLMKGTEGLIGPVLASIEISEPAVPLISHLDGRLLDAEGIADVLRKQLTEKVLWRDTVKAIRRNGIDSFVEIGPSDVLSKLVRWIERDAESFRAEELLSCQPR